MLTTLTVLFFTVFFTTNTVGNTPATQNDLKKIVVVYSEKNVPIEGKEILLGYYDEITLACVILKDKTDSAGTITFSVPGNATGASYIFTFAFSETNIMKGYAMRIPSETLFGGQDSISLNLGKGKKWYIENSGAPMQWMNFPVAGTKVEDNKENVNILKYNWGTQEAADIKRMSFENGGTKPISAGDVFLEGSVIFITIK